MSNTGWSLGIKVEKMKCKSTLRIPLDKGSHHLKIERANNLLLWLITTGLLLTIHHCIMDGLWQKEKCQPIRFTKRALPVKLRDLISKIHIMEVDSITDSDKDHLDVLMPLINEYLSEKVQSHLKFHTKLLKSCYVFT